MNAAALLRLTINDLRSTTYKFLSLFILATIYLLLSTTPTFAQTAATPSATNYQQINPNYITSQSPHSASLAIYNFNHAMSCLLIGQSPMAPCLEYKLYRNAQGMIQSVPYLSQTNTNNGILGVSLSMIGEVIGNPPVRSSEFIAHFGEQIGVKSAYAQVDGSGSGVLAPIFRLWEVSRNIAYLAMILIFVFVGLMVMFRQKLNPQTVVSVQLALPGLVIGLIMITFSYFFASLISDMAFVGTNLVGYYFSLADPTNPTPTQLPLEVNGKEQNTLSIFARYTRILSQQRVYGLISSVWDDLGDPNKIKVPVPFFGGLAEAFNLPFMDPQTVLSIFSTMLAVQFVLPFGGLFGGAGQATAGGLAIAANVADPKTLIAMSLSFVAMLVLLYSMFKLLFKLLSNLLSIIFLTIASPFYFLAASIPGRQGLVSSWIFNMLCNTLAFPAVFAVFYFVAFILGKGQPNTLFLVDNIVSVTNHTTFPLLGGIEASSLNVLLAFAALIATPSIPDIICKAVGKPSQLGAMAAGSIGGAIGAGQKYQNQIQGGISGFTGTAGRLTNSTEYKIEDIDANGRPIYKVDPYRSHAGTVAKVGQWVNRKFRGAEVIPHERTVINPNNPTEGHH